MAMIGGMEILVILIAGFLTLLLAGGLAAILVLLIRKGTSQQTLERRLQTLEQQVRELQAQKKGSD
jgi:fructose-specific phosphotransferase system IIC component